jgi:hypothetical protein
VISPQQDPPAWENQHPEPDPQAVRELVHREFLAVPANPNDKPKHLGGLELRFPNPLIVAAANETSIVLHRNHSMQNELPAFSLIERKVILSVGPVRQSQLDLIPTAPQGGHHACPRDGHAKSAAGAQYFPEDRLDLC